MKLIKTSYQILNPTGYTIKDIYKSIEYASRTCYKSEESITDNSADKFVKMIIDRGHTAMLEHGTVYLIVPAEWQGRSEKENCWLSIYFKYVHNHHSVASEDGYNAYINTNYRVLVENGWLDDLEFLTEPTEFHEKRISVKFICDRGVSHEFVRHKILCVA